MFDVIIAGGGPAGLSAALMLGRCRRRVLLVDAGEPRNRHSRALHAYLTRDGIAPLDFIARGRDEVDAYATQRRPGRVVSACRSGDGRIFDVTLADGTREQCRYLLLATGVTDEVPDVGGLRACYGRTVFHCPYCDGWEWRERRLGALAAGVSGAKLALSLKTWSGDVALFLNGGRLERRWRERLARNRIAIHSAAIVRLDHEDGELRGVTLSGNRSVACDALFFSMPQRSQSPLAVDLGCACNSKGTVETGRLCETNVPGVFVAGDASHDAQYVAVAVAEGLKAALAINQAMQSKELIR
jgi:thioredoxin reductase